MSESTIIAIGSGGGILGDKANSLHNFILAESKKKKPRIGFIPTASGDSQDRIDNFYKVYNDKECIPSDLSLFRRNQVNLEPWFKAQDIFLVGGGNTVNMLAVWREHSVDLFLEEAWAEGKVMAGGSAGAICWFSGGITDSYSEQLSPLNDGLRLLDGSICPHYNSASGLRKSSYEAAISNGYLKSGFAVDNYAAVVFKGKSFREVVTSKNDNKVKYVTAKDGVISTKPIETRRL